MDEIKYQTPQVASAPIPALPAGKNRLGLVIKIIVGVVVILVVSSGTVAGILYSRVWDPLWSPFRPDPEEVMAQISSKMEGLNSLSIDSKLDIVLDAADKSQNVKISVSAKSDSDKNNNATGTLYFTLTGAGQNFSITVENRSKGGTAYTKIIDFTVPTSFMSDLKEYGVDVAIIKGQWIKIDGNEVSKYLEQYLGTAGAGMIEQNIKGQQQLQNQITQIISGKKFFLVKQELPDEEIKGEKVYHYVVGLNKEEVKKTIPEIFKSALKSMESEQQIPIGSGLIADMMGQMIGNVLDQLGEINADIWIGKKDNLVYKVNFQKAIDLSKLVEYFIGSIGFTEAGSGAIPKMNLAINGNIEFSNFNKPVQVEAPKKFIPFLEIAQNFMAKYQEKINEENIVSGMSQLQSFAEMSYLIYENYYNFSCTKTETKSYCAEIKSKAGTAPVIKVSKTKYCGYVKLPIKQNDKDRYVCFDNLSATRRTPVISVINPGLKGYCTGKTFVCPKVGGLE